MGDQPAIPVSGDVVGGVCRAEICFGDRGALADRDCHRDHSFAIVSVAGAVSCAARDIVDAGVGGFRDFYGVGGGICCE